VTTLTGFTMSKPRVCLNTDAFALIYFEFWT
jgi:hypothetical protein